MTDFSKLPPEQAMQAAAQDLGAPDDFFARMWKQESGNGTNMLSPRGARGHFQVMPPQLAEMEKRFGRKMDPDNFSDSLLMAHNMMGENLKRWKNLPDATRAYNSGWTPARWDNPETNGYIKALIGDAPPVALERAQTRAKALGEATPARSPLPGAVDFLIGQAGQVEINQQDYTAARQGVEDAEATAGKERAAEAAAPGFFSVTSTKYGDPRQNPDIAIYAAINRERGEPWAEGQSAVSTLPDVFKQLGGLSDDETGFYLENALGPQDAERAKGEIMVRRDIDSQYQYAGPLTHLATSMIAGLGSGANIAAGFGVGAVLRSVGLGAVQAVKAGAGVRAVAIGAVESGVGNVAVTGALDAAGETKSLANYMEDFATGTLFYAPFAKGTMKQATQARMATEAIELATKARAAHDLLHANALSELGTGPHRPEQVQNKMDEILGREIVAEQKAATAVSDTDSVLPRDVFDSIKRADEDLANGLTNDADPLNRPELDEPDVLPTTPEQQTANQVAAVSTMQEDGVGKPVTRVISESSGAETVITWKINKAGTKAEGATIRNVLDSLGRVLKDHKFVQGAQGVIAQRLIKTLQTNVGNIPVTFDLKTKTGLYYHDNTALVTPTTRPIGPGTGIDSVLKNMSKWAIDTVIHEITHAATHNQIESIKANGGTPAQVRAVARLEELRADMRAALKARAKETGEPVDRSREAGYAGQNIHEFVAQVYSDEGTRKFLAGMERDGAPSKMRQFVQAVAELMGIGTQPGRVTALEQALQDIDTIITSSDTTAPRKSKGVNKGTVIPRERLLQDSPAFRKWFGNSTVYDILPDGTKAPAIWLHGTARDIRVFQPKQADAVFATQDGKIADNYRRDSGRWVSLHTEELIQALPEAERNQARYEVAAARAQEARDGYGIAARDKRDQAIAKAVGGKSQIIPLFIRAESPWDFRNPAHVDLVVEAYRKAGTPEADLPAIQENVSLGSWPSIEEPHVIAAMRKAGFDSFHSVDLPGQQGTNLAVFDSNQVKHAAENSGAYSTESNDIFFGPVAPAKKATSSNLAQRGRALHLPKIVAHARALLAADPIDPAKLKVLTRAVANIGGMSHGLVLARSQNPIMQLFAARALEITTGAGGRSNTAAVQKNQLHTKFLGRTLPVYDSLYSNYASSQGKSVATVIWDDATTGNGRREFGTKVYEEIRARLANGQKTPGAHKSIEAAADQLEVGFKVMLDAQKAADTLGSANLPDTSFGYIPQALDGNRLAAADPAVLRAVEAELGKQFAAKQGWDADFAKDFAAFYVKRQQRRALGFKEMDTTGNGGVDGLEMIHDVLSEMAVGATPAQLTRLAAAKRSGLSQTKRRLDLDLTAAIPGGRLQDLYITDPLLLYRRYANRTSGNVALHNVGIPGLKGLSELKEAALEVGSHEGATLKEFEAFDQVTAELLGVEVPGAVRSVGASNLRMLTGLVRLGSLPFTQAAETYQLVHTLGLRALLHGVGDLPKHLGNVGRRKRGEAVTNDLLGSVEIIGGEIGTEGYNAVVPWETPDAALQDYMHQSGLGTRLLSAGVHLQGKVSFFRALMAAQHRMTSEQIVIKALKFLRDGAPDGRTSTILADMGLHPDLAKRLQAELPNIATFDATGNVRTLDLGKATDIKAAQEFVSAIHRGTSQIIQGSFIGERNAWAHNDWVKLITQLRTFGILAAEKQWGRTGMTQGYAAATGALLAQMALAAPIYAARVQLNSLGREDREEYVKKMMSTKNIVRGVMNYSALTHVTSDLVDLSTAVLGGWGGEHAREALGMNSNAKGAGLTLSRLVPGAGLVDAGLAAGQGQLTPHQAIKQLPFSNLWYLIPVINAVSHEK